MKSGIFFDCRLWHPLKGVCQEKTPPHSKKVPFFLQGHHPELDQPLFIDCVRVFKSFRCGSLIDLQPGTHQVQGQWKIKLNRSLQSEETHKISKRRNHPFCFMTPGPIIGPQKNIGTLLCPRGCFKTQGSKSASHRGLTTRADHEKRHPPGFLFEGVQRCANQEIGI